MSEVKNWYKGAVIYQIYPRSFKDTNGDGIGDLKGITGKLDYVASLGVDGIWLSPFFTSPMKDFGYDVADYRGVDPMFGDLNDFDALLDKAHGLGLKVIIDQVMSHSSDRHAWFQESRQSKDNPKADWYVWADPKPDGAPPNNWQSVFGGPAWEYDIRRGQYYLHNFLKEQPDLNFHNEEARAAVLDEMRFWLERGVDGFRLDVANFYLHDAELRDNPPNPRAYEEVYPEPYGMQLHHFDKSQPGNLAMIERMRALTDEYGAFMVGEIADAEKQVFLSAEYTRGETRLHTAYSFSFLHADAVSHDLILEVTSEYFSHAPDGCPAWAFSNHDVVRVASRWFNGADKYGHDPRLSQCLNALLLCLNGTIFMYQGEELGLPEAEVPYEQIQDPFGKYLYPFWQGRDGCRTPMPWENNDKAGFTSGAPWLPVGREHPKLSASEQDGKDASTLTFTRNFIKLRKNTPALKHGEVVFREHPPEGGNMIMFERRHEQGRVFCMFNASETPVKLDPPPEFQTALEVFNSERFGRLENGRAALPAYGLLLLA